VRWNYGSIVSLEPHAKSDKEIASGPFEIDLRSEDEVKHSTKVFRVSKE
jgi:hypothetical protein